MSDMGSGEMGGATKTTKTSSNAQEQQQPSATSNNTVTPMTYPEWAAAMQAYYGSAAPSGYFPSTVGSGPQPHPYMWGAQPMMPPYGTPPYAAMYPHGGMYAHPSMAHGAHPYGPYVIPAGNPNDAQGKATADGGDAERKAGDGGKASKSSMKSSKGSLGSLSMMTVKDNNTSGKDASTRFSQRHDTSGSEGSTDGSDENSQYVSDTGCKRNTNHVSSEVANSTTCFGSGKDTDQEGTIPVHPISIGGKQGVGAGPLTNLNIGMDYWSGGAPSVLANGQGHRVPSSTIIPSGVSGDLWPQDERELKKQRRKQSNRESARRSRLRKQAECEELQSRVETLTDENVTLRGELARITEQCKKLSANNSSLLEQMRRRRGIHREHD